MKSIRKTLALLLALVLLCSMAPIGITANAAFNVAYTVSFTMEGFYDYEQASEVLALINDARKEAGFPTLTRDEALTDYAMTRAAEVYVFADTNRPDGTDWKDLLESPFYEANTMQSYAVADTAEKAFAKMSNSAALTDSRYRSAAVGCFRQTDGAIAWVLLCSDAEAEAPFNGRGSVPKEVRIDADPSNLGGDILHHYFSNALCACYLFEGTTIGTALQLRNRTAGNVIVPSDIDYGYTTTDDSVFTIDNDAHTITAIAPGKARLRITIDGLPIPTLSNDADVEVWEMPVLTYEKTDDEIHINYADFPSTVDLYLRGTKDEMWTVGNREADSIFEHTNIDPTETYTYVMRYWDEWLDNWVVVGEPLVVQLGDETPVLPSPAPTPPPEPDGLKLPTEADLPNRTSEPSLAEVQTALERIKTEFYPHFTEWPYTTTYKWNGGKFTLADGSSFDSAKDEPAFALAVSDLIFGKLPARLDYDMTVNDLRPGDIFCDNNGDWYVVQDVSPLYVIVGEVGSRFYPDDVIWDVLYPVSALDNSINFVLTRYTSNAPGADTLHPSIVPSNAEVLAEDINAPYINHVYSSVIKWTLTTDGTLYLEGYGRPGYGDDGWKNYKKQIKRVVFGHGVTSVLQDTFASYEALEEVVLSDTISEIRRSTFTNCTNLKSIQFGKGLKTIEENAFQYSGLEALVLPHSLESLGAYAFSSCTNLKSLYVPNSITEWGNNVFTSCDALEELTLEEGLTTIGFSAFNHLDSLKTVNIPGSIKTIRQMAFYFSDIETLNIAEGVEVIEEEAFAYCKQLKEIHLPDTITEVQNNAFRDCDNVTDVYFYGTEARWNSIEIGTSNDCLAGSWWSPVTIHFMDSKPCFHKNITVLPAVAPTCEESGLSEGKVCADCDEVLSLQEVIPPLDHDYAEVKRKEPTCTTTGTVESVCTRDRNHRHVKLLPPTGIHTYENGSCTVCGKEEPTVMENPFTDVSEADWYFNPVMWAKENNVTGGTSATTFGPNDGCTRAQVVTFLWAANGKPEPKSSVNPFDDVADDAWYLKPVLWAVENGITGGISKHEFGPDATCTRAQIATFLYAAQKKPPVKGGSTFSDVADTDWYAAPVIWAAENDVTGGIGNGMFGPNNTCTRAQVVTFLYKVYG